MVFLVVLGLAVLQPAWSYTLSGVRNGASTVGAVRWSHASTQSVKRQAINEQSTALHMFGKRKWSPGMAVGAAKKTPDFLAAFSYVAATSVQWTLILSFLHLFQLQGLENLPGALSRLPTALTQFLPSAKKLSTYLVGAFAFFMSLKSRVFSPLDNSRPTASASDPVFKERRRPWWQPPPIAFPIIWLTIAVLRSVSTALIYNKTGTLLCLPIFAFFGHLSIGDTWNTINNVEKRLGTAFLGVIFVWASALYTAYQYYETFPLAGEIFAPSCAWLTVAMFLVYSIWRLNSLYLADRSTLFPSVEEGTRSAWRMPFTSLTK